MGANEHERRRVTHGDFIAFLQDRGLFQLLSQLLEFFGMQILESHSITGLKMSTRTGFLSPGGALLR